MITGFNTDIQHEGVTYHVQTEDKGVNTSLILSLVYDGGTILASKRSSYSDLLNDAFDEKVLAERLQKQHKLMCAAVRAGRIEDLKRMTMNESANKKAGLIAQKQVKIAKSEAEETDAGKSSAVQPSNENFQLLELPLATPRQPIDLSETLDEKRLPKTISKPASAANLIALEDEIIIEAVEIIEEEIILPAEAVEIINDAANKQTGDDKLKIELPEGDFFKSGEKKTLNLLVRRGDGGRGLGGANIMVKVLGSSFRPLIYHSKTDDKGVAIIEMQLPQFKGGRAAVLIRAMFDGERTVISSLIYFPIYSLTVN